MVSVTQKPSMAVSMIVSYRLALMRRASSAALRSLMSRTTQIAYAGSTSASWNTSSAAKARSSWSTSGSSMDSGSPRNRVPWSRSRILLVDVPLRRGWSDDRREGLSEPVRDAPAEHPLRGRIPVQDLTAAIEREQGLPQGFDHRPVHHEGLGEPRAQVIETRGSRVVPACCALTATRK